MERKKVANENLSGVDPSVTLSGLSAGAPSIGGTAQPGISGAPGQGGAGGFLPGMEGGMDLATLLQMLQAGDTSGVGSAGSINQSLMQGSLGQQTGGLGAGSFGQTQPGYVAGQSAAGGTGQAQGAAAGAIDPASIIQKFLGVAGQGAKLLSGSGGAGTASPTAGSGATGGEQQAFTTGIASPVNEGQDLAQSGLFQGGVSGGGGLSGLDPTLDFLYTSGALNGLGQNELSQLKSLPPDQLAGLKTALLGGETQSDLGSQLLGGQSGASGFTLGTGGLDTSMPATGAPTDVLGGGVGLLSGLMNLYQGAQSGNAGSILGGAGSTLSGANQLLPGMGLGEAGQTLGLLGGGANAPFAAFSLANAIDKGDAGGIAQGLASLYGTTVPVINTIFGTSLPTLTSVAGTALSSLGGTLGGSLGSALGSAGSFLGGTAGAAGAAGATGAAGAGASAGATAGATAAAAPAAMLIGPYIVAKLIQLAQTMGDKENVEQLQNRVRNIYGQLPGEMQQLQGIPGIASQLNATSSPDQAADLMRQLNDIQRGYQEGGWENYEKYGQTGVQTGAEGNLNVDLPQVQTALRRMSPFMGVLDTGRINAQDVMSRAGIAPSEIAAQTGRYINPIDVLQSYSPEARAALFNVAPGTEAEQNAQYGQGGTTSYMPGVAAGRIPGMAETGVINTPWGLANRGLYEELYGLQNRPDYKQGMMDFMSRFGTQFDPMFAQQFLGQPQQAAVPPQIMAAANSPNASTAGAVGANDTGGRLTEETLMDILRRMSPGAAYAGV